VTASDLIVDRPSDGVIEPEPAGCWYVVRAKPRAEAMASASLQARGLPTYLPLWQRRRRRRPDYAEPLFPGYLFVQSDGRLDWELRARSAPNVVRLLGDDDGPQPVPGALIAEIRARCVQQAREPFVAGQRVRVTSGPFRELDAIFDGEYPSGDRARVFIQMVSRLVPVVVDIETLRRLL
jgi:transcriptional antiterminator RfaH